MRDVAVQAGVSLKTVSRVVNGDRAVASVTAAKVRAAIEAIGYHRNEIARMLRPGQRSQLLGLVVADLHNPFYMALAVHVEAEVRPAGFDVVIANTRDDPDLERRAVETLLSRRCDGLILVPTFGSNLAHDEIPIVYLDRIGVAGDVATVVVDNEAGAYQAVAHLAALGHRRIAYIGSAPSKYLTARGRLRGYHAALGATGLPLDPALEVLGTRTIDQATEAATTLLVGDSHIDAIFAANNRNTIGALTAMKSLGRWVSVVGFDDFETAEMLDVSVVSYSFHDLAAALTDLLLDQIAGAAVLPTAQVVATTLLRRASSTWSRGQRATGTNPSRR